MKERIKELEEQLEQTNNRLMETCITWVECPGFMIHPEHRCGKCLSCVTAQRDEWKARYKGTHVPPDQKKSFAEMYDESFTKLMVTKSDLNDARQATTKAKRELADYIDESGALYRRTRDRAEQAEVRVQSLEATLAECNEQVYAAERDCVEAQDEVARLKSGTPHPGDGSCRLCGEAPADPHGICDTCRNLPAEVETLKALREEGRATEKRLMEIIQSAGYAHRKGWWDNAYSILKVHDGKHLDRLVQEARNAERQLADMSLETYRDKMDEMRAKLKESEQKKKMFNKVGMDMQSEAVGAQLECCSLRNDVGRLEREHVMLRDRCNTAEARRVEAEVERDDALTKLKKAE